MKRIALAALLLGCVPALAETSTDASGRITTGPLKQGTVIVEQYTSGTAKIITMYDDVNQVPTTYQQGRAAASCDGFAVLAGGPSSCITIRRR